ncbi:MAG: hypothetical protein BWX80_00476 [Candidatus Hydrogenedentes bacterium ADurb.Bin101]|nr:MAG: hypothetical protein BWX80_00476 [Candidatus Hydrogenedentes bacterium ADurb.Bin101]
MKKRLLKGLSTAAVVFLWGLVFVLCLEGAALLYQLRMERTNPFIAAYRAGQPLPPGSSMSVAPVRVSLPLQVGGWDAHPVPFHMDDDTEKVLSWGPYAPVLDNAARNARCADFFQLSTTAREVYARLGKEMVLIFDANRRLVKAYGSDKFFFEGVQWLLFRAATCGTGVVPAVYKAVDAALESGAVQEFSLYWPNPREPLAVLSAVCIPVNRQKAEGEVAGVFVNLNPDEIVSGPAGQLPEDSRWVVPHFRFKPNYTGEAHPGFSTNSLGFRDVERAVPKPAGVFRILCVGASTTQEGDANETTYPALLEKRLGAAFPGRVIEVVDAGIPGIATPLHLLRLADYSALEPDLVIIHAGVNDTLLMYDAWRVNLLPSRLRSARWFFPSLTAPSLESFRAFHREYMVRNLELMSVLFQRQGAAVAFASIAWPDPRTIAAAERQYYNYQSQYTWQFPAFELATYGDYMDASNRLLQETAAAVNGIYIPVAENLQGGTSLFTDFCHMTQEGITAKAGILFEGVYPLLEKKFAAETVVETGSGG